MSQCHEACQFFFYNSYRTWFSNLIEGTGGNAKSDTMIILKALKKHGFENQFKNVIAGFADAKTFFQEALPNRKRSRGMFTLSTLATEFLGNIYSANERLHDASYDVYILRELFYVFGKDENLRPFAWSFEDAWNKENSNEKISQMCEPFKQLTVFSKSMQKKLPPRDYRSRSCKKFFTTKVLTN